MLRSPPVHVFVYQAPCLSFNHANSIWTDFMANCHKQSIFCTQLSLADMSNSVSSSSSFFKVNDLEIARVPMFLHGSFAHCILGSFSPTHTILLFPILFYSNICSFCLLSQTLSLNEHDCIAISMS